MQARTAEIFARYAFCGSFEGGDSVSRRRSAATDALDLCVVPVSHESGAQIEPAEACRTTRTRVTTFDSSASRHRRALGPRGTVAGVPGPTSEGLLGLLDASWQIVIAVCMLIVTAIGLARLVGRGPTRMAHGVLVTGFLIVAITVVGSFAVSCSTGDDRRATQNP